MQLTGMSIRFRKADPSGLRPKTKCVRMQHLEVFSTFEEPCGQLAVALDEIESLTVETTKPARHSMTVEFGLSASYELQYGKRTLPRFGGNRLH